MFLRTVQLFLFSCIASSLAAEHLLGLETTATPIKVTSLSEVEVILSVAACTLGSVAIVIVPTMLYYKFYNQDLKDEDY